MHYRFFLPLALLTVLLLGCSGDPVIEIDDESDAGEDESDAGEEVGLYDFEAAAPWYECEDVPTGDDVVEVEAMSQVHQYFGDEDRRTVEETVEFPDGDWAQVGLVLELECPDGAACDHWDRIGSLQLVTNRSAGEEEQEEIELLRHITPYRMGMCQFVDITDLAGLLSGEKLLRSFIDTWVGPGHDEGEGWLVSARFVFAPQPDDNAEAGEVEVINVWGRRNITVGELDSDSDIDSQIEPFSFELAGVDEEISRVEAHLTTTGHSFGNTLNCAEFCEMRHDLIVNDTAFSTNPWRGDCADNPVSPQSGTWQHNRNGWCPGAVAVGDRIDITDAIESGENTLDFDILLANGEPYDNTSPVDLLPYTVVALKLYVYR